MNNDLGLLKWSGIFHIVWGVLAILFGLLFGIFYIAVGANTSVEITGNLSPGSAHKIFLVVGIAAIVFASAYGIVMIMAGGKLRKQRGYRFCFFVSILDLFGFPSMILGILTLMALVRPTVKALFNGADAQPPVPTAQTVS